MVWWDGVMTDVLILGGTGWLSGRVARAWTDAGASVTCLARGGRPAPEGTELIVADRAERAGLSQGIGFGLTNTAWALGAVTGPAVGGALAEAFGDAVPYLACGALCALTLVAAVRGTARLRPA